MSTRGRFGGRRGGGWFQGARISRGALYLLFAEVGLSLVFLLLDDSARAEMAHWLAATPDSVWREGRVWTLATTTFLQPNFVSLLFHGFLLWMFIPAIEQWWGTRRFLIFAAATSLTANVVGTLVGLAVARYGAIAGLDPFIYASIVAFGVLYANRPVQFFGVLPMTGKQLTIGIVVFVALFVGIQQAWAEGAAFASAMVLGWGLTSGKIAPRLWYLRWKQKRLRKHLKIVRGDDERGDKRWLN